jgi:hypothetical protein
VGRKASLVINVARDNSVRQFWREFANKVMIWRRHCCGVLNQWRRGSQVQPAKSKWLREELSKCHLDGRRVDRKRTVHDGPKCKTPLKKEMASARSELRPEVGSSSLTAPIGKTLINRPPPAICAISARVRVVRQEAAGEAPTMTAPPMAAP